MLTRRHLPTLLLASLLTPFACTEAPHPHDHDHTSATHTHAAPAGPTVNTIASGLATLPAGDPAMERASREMAVAATALWDALSPDLKTKSTFPFDAEERFNWHYIPRTRKGVTWNDMSPDQKAKARAFLASGLSTRGLSQVDAIMSLDLILKELENGSPTRDPGNYAFSLFGTPAPTGAWGWRFEGHHVSINFTIVNGRASAGPVFFGTNPAEVKQGPRTGERVLAVEEDLGRSLIKALSPDQQKTATYTDKAPNEIVTTNSRKANPGPPVGIKAADLTPAQKKILMTLIENYAYRLRPEVADADLKKIDTAGPDNIHFAWAGGQDPGQAHYYRIHGPTFLVEFDNAQNGANHIHTVWRDAANDFGEDLLRQHYDAMKNNPDHPH